MKKLIFTWSPAGALCDWQQLDANGNREGAPHRNAPLSELREAAGERELLWLAPGQRLLATSARLPVKGRDKLLRALPYALEEHFAEEPDKLFFALASGSKAETTSAIAADRDWLRAALATLGKAGVEPQHVRPDYLVLPREPDCWTVLADAGLLYVRSAAAGGYTLEADSGWAVLERRLASLEESARPQSIRYIRGREPYGEESSLEAMVAEREPVRDGLFGVAAQGIAQAAPVNLRQGPFKRGSGWSQALKPWLPAGWALAAVVVLAIVGFSASWVHNAQAERHLNTRVHRLYSQLFPEQPWFGNATTRRLIRTRLTQPAGASNKNGLLSLLAVLAAAAPDDVNIESLTYQSGTLQIRVHAANVSSLDTLVSTISGDGRVAVQIRSTHQTGAGVEGALILGAGARS